MKMDCSIFLLWQNISIPTLRSHRLDGHLIGKDRQLIVVPVGDDEISNTEKATIPNPEYDIWIVANQSLVG